MLKQKPVINLNIYAIVVGEVTDADFHFYVVQEGGREIIALNNMRKVGMDFGTVDGRGIAYIRVGASPRDIGKVNYYPEKKVVKRFKPFEVPRPSRLEAIGERNPAEESQRPKRAYEQ